MNKNLLFASVLLSTLAIADNDSEKIQSSINKLTTAFEPSTIVMNNLSPESIFRDGFDSDINNQWFINIKSKYFAHIKKISIQIDGIVIAHSASIILQPTGTSQYLFGNSDFLSYINKITKGYTFLGIYKTIRAKELKSFKDYNLKKINLVFDWVDKSNNYNQTNFDFIMVLGK